MSQHRVRAVRLPGVSQDGGNIRIPRHTAQFGGRSSASRPVAVTTSNGPCRASALAITVARWPAR